MSTVQCVFRGTDEIDNAVAYLDDTKVQLLFIKFPVGTGTFKRNKFLCVKYIGPKCGVVKRGKAVNEIANFTERAMKGVASFSTTDKSSLSFESLVHQFKNIFISDNGSFSMEQIREEYRNRLQEERRMMHRERRRVKKPKAMSENRHMSLVLPPHPPSRETYKKSAAALSKVANDLLAVADRVIVVLRDDNGPINWAVFAADPDNLHMLSYGRGGIFELIKNLPNDQWLFGLFRISFLTGASREHRVIFFQWIGSNLKAVRNGSSAGLYPAMAKALSPYAFEIYLVGLDDLNAQAIINKTRAAFQCRHPQNGVENREQTDMRSIVFTEESYKTSLLAEQEEMNHLSEKYLHQQPERWQRRRTSELHASNRSVANLACSATMGPQVFDVDETISLVQSDEGGLMWALFEVQ